MNLFGLKWVLINENSAMFKGLYKILLKYPLSITVLAAIVYLSFFKPPKVSFETIKYIDKIVHLVMYGGLCSVMWFEYYLTHASTSKKKIVMWIFFAPLLFSGAIEFGQSYLTSYRGGDFLDFVFNSMGVVLAALFSIYVTKPLMKKYNLLGKRRF